MLGQMAGFAIQTDVVHCPAVDLDWVTAMPVGWCVSVVATGLDGHEHFVTGGPAQRSTARRASPFPLRGHCRET